MNDHSKLMHLLILIGDAGQSKLSSQGALSPHHFPYHIKEQFFLAHIPNALKLMV